MSSGPLEDQIEITISGEAWHLDRMGAKNGHAVGHGVWLRNSEGDEVLAVRGDWPGQVFFGPFREQLIMWLVGELRREYNRGSEAGAEMAQAAMRKALGL